MNANYKQLKITLALGVKKLRLFSLAVKLGEFLLFDDFFSDLADFSLFNFQDLEDFWYFDFFDFPLYLILSLLNPSTSLLSLFLLKTGLLLLYLLEASLSYDPIVFNIEMSEVA